MMFNSLDAFGLHSSLAERDVCEQDDIHQQGVDDGGNGHGVVVEDKGAGGKGYALGCILHTDFYDYRALLGDMEFHGSAKKATGRHGC